MARRNSQKKAMDKLRELAMAHDQITKAGEVHAGQAAGSQIVADMYEGQLREIEAQVMDHLKEMFGLV